MNTKPLRERLLAKEQELLADMARFEDQARDARTDEVGDEADQAVSSEQKSSVFQENTLAAETLKQVREALQRIEDGTYGHCIDCGRAIELSRLEAVPWASYCLTDQEKHDQASGTNVAVAPTL